MIYTAEHLIPILLFIECCLIILKDYYYIKDNC